MGRNASYSACFKTSVVEAYLNGEGSYRELAIKYNISSEITIRQWVLKYNGHEKLKASGTGGSAIMTKGRKTTYAERIEIVHNHNYDETSEKFKVSYQQARTYTLKYEDKGIEALRDRRRKRKCQSLKDCEQKTGFCVPKRNMQKRRLNDKIRHDDGIKVNDKRILRIYRNQQIRSNLKYRYDGCTRPSRNPSFLAENVLNREIHVEHPNEKWVTDVTEFKYGTSLDHVHFPAS